MRRCSGLSLRWLLPCADRFSSLHIMYAPTTASEDAQHDFRRFHDRKLAATCAFERPTRRHWQPACPMVLALSVFKRSSQHAYRNIHGVHRREKYKACMLGRGGTDHDVEGFRSTLPLKHSHHHTVATEDCVDVRTTLWSRRTWFHVWTPSKFGMLVHNGAWVSRNQLRDALGEVDSYRSACGL